VLRQSDLINCRMGLHSNLVHFSHSNYLSVTKCLPSFLFFFPPTVRLLFSLPSISFSPYSLPSLPLIAQADRLASLGRCTHLTQQLSHPLSLDDARALITADDTAKPMPLSVIIPNSAPSFSPFINRDDPDAKGRGSREIKSNNSLVSEVPGRGKENEKSQESFSQNWVQDLPSYGLNDAVDLHTQTIEALRNKSKWSLVAVPLNLTGPPVDIAALNLESDREKGRIGRKGHSNPRLASAWADGEDLLMICCLLSFSLYRPVTSCISIVIPVIPLPFQSLLHTTPTHLS
jgi:hypothetical protein